MPLNIQPEAGARVDYPLSNLLLSHPLLHQSLLWPKQLHRQLVVRRCKDVLKLVPNPVWLCFTGYWIPELTSSVDAIAISKIWNRLTHSLTGVVHFLCQSYQRLKFVRNPCRVCSEAWKWRELVCFTWRYPLGLAPLSVFHKETPRLSLLKNGPEAANWNVAQGGKERTLLLGFSASGPAGGTVGPLARGGDHIWKGKLLLATSHNELCQPISSAAGSHY